MNQTEFTKAFTSLTERQHEVLLKVLAGARDAEIATELHITKDTVRKHIENICRIFGLFDPDNPGSPHRPELISIIAKHRPELFGNSPNLKHRTSILLSAYRSNGLDLTLITQLDASLKAKGYEVFLAAGNLRLAKNGLQQIYAALNRCDYLILLLSQLSACSEMVTEEVRLAKTLQSSRADRKPIIIPIRINCPFNLLNHDLRGYLQGIYQHELHLPENSNSIIQNILKIITSGEENQGDNGNNSLTKTISTIQYAATPNYPPQPVAEPELPTGQVELASAFYVERPGIDQRCYEAIAKPGALIRIKAPRQMGKTSLMARILHRSVQIGYRTVPLSFHLADSKIFTDLDLFLRWFCANVSLQMDLPERLSDYWNSIFGSKVACKSYFERYLLANTNTPIVLGLDEVDVVFKYRELAADFFSLLRAWHEEAKNREIWKKLRLVVVHSTEVYIPMDINQSPFNVGLPIELPELQATMVLELAQRHGLAWSSTEVEKLMAMV